MARGGRVIYKKATTSKNRKARSKREGDDDEDEEYVVEEDEDEESESNFGSDANSRDLSDEESFDFRGSDRSDDEEEKEIKIARSKKKRGNRRKSRVFDDEMDADYELDDEEEEKAVEIARSNKKRRNLKKSRFSDDEMDSDYELNYDEDEKEFEIAKSKKKQVNRRKSRVSDNEMESDYEFDGEDEDEEVKIARSKKKKRNMKKSRDSDNEIDSDYEFDCEEERKEVKVARMKKRRTLKKYGISDDDLDPDYKLDDEEEEREVEIGRLKKKSVVSADEMDSNYELDHEEEDEEFEIEIPKRKQGDHNKNRVFDYEMEDLLIPKRRGRGIRGKKETGDSDYELDDEDDEKQFNIARSKKNRGSCKKSGVSDDQDEEKELLKKNQENCKKSRVSNDKVEDISVPKRREKGRPKKQKSRDSDYELDGEDFEDEDFSPNEDDFDEDEIAIASKRRAKVSKTKGRKKRRQKCVVKSSDDDFIVKDRVSVGRKRIRSMNARKRSSEADLEYLDFVTSDDDFVEKDIARINNCRKTNKNVTKGPGLRGRRKKRSVRGSESSDSDFVISDDDDDDDVDDEDNFNVKDQMVSDKQEMNRKKEVGKSNRRKRRKKSMVDSESSDSDYLISEDDEDFIIEEDHVMQRKKSKKGRKKGSRSSVYYDSESFDFDDAISEEEVRDMRIGGGLNREKPKRVIAGKKVEEKGKEKQADDLGKQVCGICLSEEKKSVVQGLLNCCTHYFCFACIMEWSKVESRCPLCKRRFATISKLGKSNPGFGMKSSVIRVKKRDQVYQPSEGELRGMLDPYENVVCMECQQGGDDNLMLLCDTCDSSAHTYCVGLGREVPEGNWYCECCRSVSEGPSNSQFQDTMLNQETRNTNLFCGITERSGFSNAHVSINSPRPSSLRIDLNASPRDFPGEDHFVSTPTSGSGASTVSGRRHIRQRIHVILSNNRQRQANAEATIPASVNLNPLPSVSSSERRQQNLWPFFRSRTNLASCMINEGSSFRHVDHAKEEVQHLVKCHLKNLSQNRILDRSTFKEIARKSTHTILAACGIEHRRNMVSTAIEPPENCVHDSNDGPSHLLKGCCSSCFESFVKDVLQQKIDTTS